MKKVSCLLFALLVLFSLVKAQKISLTKAQKINYFPLSPHDNNYIDTFAVKWYSEQLAAMNEPVLYNDKSGNETYRFTWLRSFDHPIAVRIEKQGDSYILFWKMCSGSGGHSPGKLILDKHKIISRLTWNQFKEKLDKIAFWGMSTNEKGAGMDGAEWILEGLSGNKYHVTGRWSPEFKTDYYQCCDFLLKLTDIKIPPDRKY